MYILYICNYCNYRSNIDFNCKEFYQCVCTKYFLLIQESPSSILLRSAMSVYKEYFNINFRRSCIHTCQNEILVCQWQLRKVCNSSIDTVIFNSYCKSRNESILQIFFPGCTPAVGGLAREVKHCFNNFIASTAETKHTEVGDSLSEKRTLVLMSSILIKVTWTMTAVKTMPVCLCGSWITMSSKMRHTFCNEGFVLLHSKRIRIGKTNWEWMVVTLTFWSGILKIKLYAHLYCTSLHIF